MRVAIRGVLDSTNAAPQRAHALRLEGSASLAS